MALSRRSKSGQSSSSSINTSFLSTGTNIDADIAKNKARQRPNLKEFYFSKAEMNNKDDPTTGKPKRSGTNYASAIVHFAVNYADQEYMVAVPRISIQNPNGRYESFTSIGNDCAIAKETGQNPTIKPVYVLIDHREVEYEGTVYADNMRVWMPGAAVRGLVDAAIETLSEAMDIPIDDLDITEYAAKITKTGTGKTSAWSIAFSPKESLVPDEVFTKCLNFFYGKATVEADAPEFVTVEAAQEKLGALLAPDPRYMISEGGTYSVAPKSSGGGNLPF